MMKILHDLFLVGEDHVKPSLKMHGSSIQAVSLGSSVKAIPIPLVSCRHDLGNIARLVFFSAELRT